MKKIKGMAAKMMILSSLALVPLNSWAKEKINIDAQYFYSGNDLGLTLSEGTSTFKCWAPLAKSVKVLLFKDAGNLEKPSKSLKMTKDAENPGVWVLNADISEYSYYKYEIANPKKKAIVCDIWAKSASPESVASQIVDINTAPEAIPQNVINDKEWGTVEGYYNPFGENKKTVKSMSDAIIYEMHIRDWSRVEVSDSSGKFRQIADGDKIIAHLKDLGVTHVQILPSFEYAEKNTNKMYNWGYNPYNYNVPEGRYTTEGYTDGTKAVQDMRYMISKLHDNGIAVVMDVVYNHTSGTGDNSIYDLTVPEYFYRLNADGTYSNGSGCGNEVATNNKMVRKFVVDSVKHWMLDYHINGFRFDLMGLQERDTMAAVYEELYKIDPNVLVYGEPWTGGKSLVKSGCAKSTVDLITEDMEQDVNGVGCFNDDFRDAIKGGVFNPVEKGFVQGNPVSAIKLASGLTGSVRGKGGFTTKPRRSINYAECHDNHTLFDKLAITALGKNFNGDFLEELSAEQLELIKEQDKLAAAIIFLAQGTPFINGGQEFLRTKRGNHNSYCAPDLFNQIDISFKENYKDVYNTYKALIALRKANPKSFGENLNATAEVIGPNLIKYSAGNFVVYYNSAQTPATISENGKPVLINQNNGTYSKGASTRITTVPAVGFVIIEK